MTGEINTNQPVGAPLAPEKTGCLPSDIVVFAGVGGNNIYVETRENELALGTYTRFI